MQNKSINFDLFINKSNDKKYFEANKTEKNLVTEKEEKSIFCGTYSIQPTETGVENNVLTNPIYSKEKELSIFSGIFNDEQNCIFNDVNKTNEIDIQECSAVRKPEVIPKYKDDGTKDGEIEDTKQGQTGDCWILAGVNALNCSETGREAIEKSLEYKDGYTIVHTMAGDYIVTDEELAIVRSKANSGEQYSTGDDDMLILELATEKVIDDLVCKNITLTEDADSFLTNEQQESETTEGRSSTEYGYEQFIWYLLTGKVGESHRRDNNDTDEINKYLDQFQHNGGKDLVLGAFFLEHAYSIKNVTDDTVTVINPMDSSNELVYSREDFMKLFWGINVLDLSDNNPTENKFIRPQTSEEKVGDETYKVKTLIDDNGKILNKTYLSGDGSYAIRFSYDENGEIEYAAIGEYNENNQFVKEYGLDGVEEAQNIINRGLLNNSKFNYEDIATSHIGSISDEEWESIQQYLNVPGLKSQLSAMELRQLSMLSDEDKHFAVDFMLKYPDVNKSAAIYYSNSNYDNYITTDDLKDYANNQSSIIEQFIPNNLEDSWYDGFDLLNLNYSLRDCLKKIEDQCGYKDIEICYQRIIDRHLIANPYILRELDGDDIYYLSFISDDKWDKAMEYLKSNPNLSGKEIAKLIYDYIT